MRIHEFLTERIHEDIVFAMDASKRNAELPSMLGGVHWFWSTSQDEDALVHPDEEFIGGDESPTVSLRSREEWATGNTHGHQTLPQFAIPVAEEVPYEVGTFVTRFDPARIIAEATAKRRIVIEHEERNGRCRVCASQYKGEWARFVSPCWTLIDLAVIYSDHPDYKNEWRPA
jgi:hypothetical protein